MANYTDPVAVPLPAPQPEQLSIAALVVLVAGVLSLLGAGYFFYENWQTQNTISSTEKSITTHKQQVQSLQSVALELQADQKLIQQLHLVFDVQKNWDGIFTTLEGRLYKNMVLSSFQLTDQGAFTLSGITPDYTNYAKLYNSLTDSDAQNFFTSVKPTAVSKSDKTTGKDVPADQLGIHFGFSALFKPVLAAPSNNSKP